ncbi:hypothetical protein Nepgr_015184 [Nepenthes gracilis]|uniref:Serine aminopeptidase S33 domain-containing protein n=1 Tax=Nepenthes gracilis TaxID=150966 RepID=A0AAD3SLC2_NEPGR|nr:hypothetical protein Nepgr_015184 [Nepenthes gracilis]
MDSYIRYEEEFVRSSSSGLMLFTCRWLPGDQEPKALIFLLHGYAMESSISMKGTATRLVKAGYGVYGIDYIGHGRSGGLHGYVPSFDDLVDDCSSHFTTVCEREENKERMRYLLGESMGGTVAIFLHRKMPDFWDGAVLVAPMCKIADGLKPNPIVTAFLRKLSYIIPTWKIVPTPDIIDAAVRDPEAKKQILSNPYWVKGWPRLKTAEQLLNATLSIEKTLNEVSLPFLIVHGGDDKVTDPSISKLLYESASSTDKTFKLYPGMWHALTYGELLENIDLVFKDIIGWLDKRVARGNLRVEKERKQVEDNLKLGSSSAC